MSYILRSYHADANRDIIEFVAYNITPSPMAPVSVGCCT